MRATRPRLAVVALLALGAGLVLVLAAVRMGIDPPDADIKYDWLSAQAGLTSNAYSDIRYLARENGVHLIVNFPMGAHGPFPHPRPPGAVLLAIPLLAIGYDHLFALSVGINVAAGILLVILAGHEPGGGRLALTFALVGATAPFLMTLRFAGQALVVAVLVYIGWILYRSEYDVLAGTLIAVAATVKVFPLVLVIPMLLARRFKPAVVASLGFISLNCAGLLLPGVGLQDSLAAMLHASDTWLSLPTNGSLVAVLAMWDVNAWMGSATIIALSIIIVVWVRQRQAHRLEDDPTIWLALALLVTPLSWSSYDVVLIPALVCGLWGSSERVRLTAVAIWAVWIGVSLALLLGAFGSEDVGGGLLTAFARLSIVATWCGALIGWDWRNSSLTEILRELKRRRVVVAGEINL